MGFDSQEEVAYMQATAASVEDPDVRMMAEQDLATVEQLSTNIYRVSRRNEAAAAIHYNFSPLVRMRNGAVTGYLIPGIFGHGVAESEDDACALVGAVETLISPMVDSADGTVFRKGLQPKVIGQFLIIAGINLLLELVTGAQDPTIARNDVEVFVLPAILEDPPRPRRVFRNTTES